MPVPDSTTADSTARADGWMPIVGEWLATFDEVAPSDVTSKAEAGRWAAGVLGDEFAPACELARQLRLQPERPVGVQALRDTSAAMGEVLRRLRIIPR